MKNVFYRRRLPDWGVTGWIKDLNTVMIEAGIDSHKETMIKCVGAKVLILRHRDQLRLRALPYIDLEDLLAALDQKGVLIPPIHVHPPWKADFPLLSAVFIDSYEALPIHSGENDSVRMDKRVAERRLKHDVARESDNQHQTNHDRLRPLQTSHVPSHLQYSRRDIV